MLEEIFKKVQTKNIDDFLEDELKYIETFIQKGIIFKLDNKFEINSKYKIAKVEVLKNEVILKDLVNQHKNIKIDFASLNGAYNEDLVLAKRVFNPRSKIKAKVIEILDTNSSDLLVYFKDKSFYTIKENIEIENKKNSIFQENDVLLIDSKSYELKKHLGNLSDDRVDELISLYLYKEEGRLEKIDFEIDVKMDDDNRVDLSHLPFCTIDPNSAKDHDDAIYYDKDEDILYVAIADVSYFVKEGSKLDKLAFKKSTSLYLPSKVLPMLPSSLSEDLCSLKEGAKRYAYVFKIFLDSKKSTVLKSELFEATIKSHKKYSYGRIDRVLENKLDQYSSVDKEIFDYLIPLYDITKDFRAKRLKKGYEFRSVENRLILKYGKLEKIEQELSTASHQLVEECMLLANIEASKKVDNIAIYRVHEEPSFKAVSKLVDDVNILGLEVKLKKDVHSTINHIQKKAKNTPLQEEIDELIIKSQTQAQYSPKNLGHFGLGFDSYSHFTSPIRRYSDLVLHRILKSGKVPSNIEEICEYISQNERKIDQLVWDFEDRKYARWAEQHIGEELKVKVVDTQKAIAVCYKGLNGLKVVLENYKSQSLYSKLSVKIKSVNIVTKSIVTTIK